MIPTIEPNIFSDFNEEKELSMKDIVYLIEESDSHLILSKHGDTVKIGGYCSDHDALIIIITLFLKNKLLAKSVFEYFIKNREELSNDFS